MLKYNLKDIWLIKELFVEGREDGRKDKTWIGAYSNGKLGEKNEEVEETEDEPDIHNVGGRKRRESNGVSHLKSTNLHSHCCENLSFSDILRPPVFSTVLLQMKCLLLQWSQYNDWVQWTLASCVVLQPHNTCHHLHREKHDIFVCSYPDTSEVLSRGGHDYGIR
jgi:hypothetical protein